MFTHCMNIVHTCKYVYLYLFMNANNIFSSVESYVYILFLIRQGTSSIRVGRLNIMYVMYVLLHACL